MNLKKIIREEMDNSLGWINDIKPALNEEQNWVLVNDVNPSDIKEGIKIQKYLFDLGYKWFSSEIIMDTIYSIHHFPNKGLRGDLTYYNNKENERDLADKEIERNNNVYYWSQIKPNEINESNDLDWIKDIEAGDLWTPYVGMKFIVTDGSDDVIYHILDINDEEGWMELKWENNKTGEGEYFGYYMEDYYRMVGEDRVQIVHDKLNESEEDNELQWIMDIKTNNDIAQEIYDGLEWYKEPNVSTDFVKNQWSDINFSVRPGFTEKPIISPSSFYRGFTKWVEEKWGIEKERTLDVYWKLIALIHNKIKKPITESDDPLQWMKDVNPIPELKVGICFTDVMDATQREWTIVSLPMVGKSKTKFVRLFTIDEEGEGVYEMIRKDKFQEDVYTGRYKPCQR